MGNCQRFVFRIGTRRLPGSLTIPPRRRHLRLSEEQVEATLHEIGVDPKEVLELGGWRTAENVAVARVPFPEAN
jgi:hypothetical protein